MISSYTDLIDEVYQNYLDNFVEPLCPPTVDVQPDYYLPRSREWFEKGLFGNHYRSVGRNGITSEYGVTIETKQLSEEERITLAGGKIQTRYPILIEQQIKLCDERDIPTKMIILTYKEEKIEIYE